MCMPCWCTSDECRLSAGGRRSCGAAPQGRVCVPQYVSLARVRERGRGKRTEEQRGWQGASARAERTGAGGVAVHAAASPLVLAWRAAARLAPLVGTHCCSQTQFSPFVLLVQQATRWRRGRQSLVEPRQAGPHGRQGLAVAPSHDHAAPPPRQRNATTSCLVGRLWQFRSPRRRL